MSNTLYDYTTHFTDTNNNCCGWNGLIRVWIDELTCYLLYGEDTADTNDFGVPVFRKSTDGGESYGSMINVGITPSDSPDHVCSRYGAWYDRWTSGNSGTKIHVVYSTTSRHAGSERGIYYNYLDTSDDSIGTPVLVYAPVNPVYHADILTTPAITVTPSGRIIIACFFSEGSNYLDGMWDSSDGGSTFYKWSASEDIMQDDSIWDSEWFKWIFLYSGQDTEDSDKFWMTVSSQSYNRPYYVDGSTKTRSQGSVHNIECGSCYNQDIPKIQGVVDPYTKEFHTVLGDPLGAVVSTHGTIRYRKYSQGNPLSYQDTVLEDFTDITYASDPAIMQPQIVMDYELGDLYIVAPFGEDAGYAGGDGPNLHIYVSHDGGITWGNRGSISGQYGSEEPSDLCWEPVRFNGGYITPLFSVATNNYIRSFKNHTNYKVYAKPVVNYSQEGWVRSCKLNFDSSKLSGGVVDFPVLITQNNLPEEMFETGGVYAARADGQDIRFATDSEGIYPLSCEVVSFTQNVNPALGTAEVWVKIPTLKSDIEDQHIYVFYHNVSATAESADSYEGSYNVWEPCTRHVWHCESLSSDVTYSSTSYPLTDGYGKLTASASGVSVSSGLIAEGSGFDFSGGKLATQDPSLSATTQLNYMIPSDGTGEMADDRAEWQDTLISYWFNPDTMSDLMVLHGWCHQTSYGGYNFCSMALDSGEHYLQHVDYNGIADPQNITRMAISLEDMPGGSPYLFGFQAEQHGYPTTDESRTYKLFLNGLLAYVRHQVNEGWCHNNYASYFCIGAYPDMDAAGLTYFDGKIDEIRVETILRNQSWFYARYNSELPANNPSFLVPEDPSIAGISWDSEPCVLSGEITGIQLKTVIVFSETLDANQFTLIGPIYLTFDSTTMELSHSDISLNERLVAESEIMTLSGICGLNQIIEWLAGDFDIASFELSASEQILGIPISVVPDIGSIELTLVTITLPTVVSKPIDLISELISLTGSCSLALSSLIDVGDIVAETITLTANSLDMYLSFDLPLNLSNIVLTASTPGVIRHETWQIGNFDTSTIELTPIIGILNDLGLIFTSIELTESCDMHLHLFLHSSDINLGVIELGYNQSFIRLSQHQNLENIFGQFTLLSSCTLDGYSFTPYIEYRLGLRQGMHEGHVL